MLKIAPYILLVWSCLSSAASLDSVIGVGIGKDVLSPGHGFERYATLGVQYGATWKLRANASYYLALAEGQVSSYVTSLQGGAEVVNTSGQYASVFFGPANISQPDSKLSGHLQFHATFGFGVKDASTGCGLGLAWVHLSNAGIEQPNLGRDLITLQLSIPLLRL